MQALTLQHEHPLQGLALIAMAARRHSKGLYCAVSLSQPRVIITHVVVHPVFLPCALSALELDETSETL